MAMDSIPICSKCGEREAMPCDTCVNISSWGSEELRELDEDADARRDEWFRSARWGVISTGGDGTGDVITPEGAGPLRDRPHPGGWVEFGYQDDEDQDELGS
jgi:hypothetical protein